MHKSYALRFAYSPRLARVTRAALESVLMRSPLTVSDRNRVLLATSEITTNLIRHSSIKPDSVQLECSWSADEFQIRITDNGSAVPEMDQVPDLEQLLTEDVQTGGYGLAMLHAQFDRLSYTTLSSGLHQWLLALPLTQQERQQEILVVDDDGLQLEMLRLYLEPHRVTAFTSPLKALEWLKDNKPDLILSDICMPELNGRNFRNRVSELGHLQLVPFIFITGDDDEQLAQSLIQEGVDDYILKPVTRERIAQVSGRVFSRHQDLMRRTHALVDHDLKYQLRPEPVNRDGSGYRFLSLAYSAHLGGGDYWHLSQGDAGFRLILGDVMGHDLQSCFMAGRQQGFFQALTDCAEPISPSQMLALFSDWLDRYQPSLLTTLTLLSGDERQLHLCNAGAPPPLLLTTDGTVASLACTGSLPGLGSDGDFAPLDFTLAPGERLMLYSDGLTEHSTDPAGQRERIEALIGLLSQHQLYSLEELRLQLKALIEKDTMTDDISILLLERSAATGG